MTLPSKELLSEVLDEDISSVSIVGNKATCYVPNYEVEQAAQWHSKDAINYAQHILRSLKE